MSALPVAVAESSFTDEPTVMLFVGSTATTVRPEWLRRLSAGDVVRFAHHRAIELTEGIERAVEILGECASCGAAVLIVVADVECGDVDEVIDPILSWVTSARSAGLLTTLRSVELFIGTAVPADAQAVLVRARQIVSTVSSPPYLRAFILSGADPAEPSTLIALLSAVILPSRSRMRSIGFGLWPLRNERRSAVYLGDCKELPIPSTETIARDLLDLALLAATFSVRCMHRNAPSSNEGSWWPMQSVHIGVADPADETSVAFQIRYAHYRDGPLNGVLTRLIECFPRPVEFVTALDALAAELWRKSAPFAELISQVRNEFARVLSLKPTMVARVEEGCVTDALRMLAAQFAEETVLRHRIAVWPLMRQGVRPRVVDGAGGALMEEYAEGMRALQHALTAQITDEWRVRLVALAQHLRAHGGRLGFSSDREPQHFVVLPSRMSTDLRDELWIYGSRAAIVALIEAESDL